MIYATTWSFLLVNYWLNFGELHLPHCELHLPHLVFPTQAVFFPITYQYHVHQSLPYTNSIFFPYMVFRCGHNEYNHYPQQHHNNHHFSPLARSKHPQNIYKDILLEYLQRYSFQNFILRVTIILLVLGVIFHLRANFLFISYIYI